jgi:putative glutamine amidotransferase
MLVGITQRVDISNTYNERRDSIDQKLVDWVMKAGFDPILIPNSLVDLSLPIESQTNLYHWLNLINVNAILLSGGNDIGTIPERDLTEKCILQWSEVRRKPVLGICRGMQMMGIYAGENLVNIDGHVKTQHKLKINKKDIGKLPNLVNSYHNQVLKNCPTSYRVLARSYDGNLEAMMHKDLPWEAWMWHPERETSFSKTDHERFKRLIFSEK